MYLIRFDENWSLQNLEFCFEIEIFSQYKVSVSVGGALTPPRAANTPFGVVIFLDGYLSEELISTSKTNGWTIYFAHISFSLNFQANKWETMCIWWGTEQRPIYAY